MELKLLNLGAELENKIKNLININSLGTDVIEQIVSRAHFFAKNPYEVSLRHKKLAFIFFENSTRTRFSFEVAAKNLNMDIFHFDGNVSSLSKGESFVDTLNNLEALGIDGIILRNKTSDLIESGVRNSNMSFVNAGSGSDFHPTQALLDYYTMKKYLGTVEGKKIVIVGDILHSRVAKSNIALLNKFGAKVYALAPSAYQDKTLAGVTWENSLDTALQGANVVMCLRIQKERIEENIDFDDYIKNYQISNCEMLDGAYLMHPGPVNIDVEIASSVLQNYDKNLILEQAKNGVFVRMAILEMLFGGALC